MRFPRLFAVLVLLLTMIGPAAAIFGTAHAATASISLNPNALIAPGGTVTVTGGGFAPNSAITLRLDTGTLAGGITTDGSGNFSANVNANNLTVGVHTVSAADGASNTAVAALYAVSLTLSTSAPAPGSQVIISGQGFLASQPLTISLGGQQVLSNSTDSTGNFSNLTFTVPSNLSGQQPLRVQSGNSTNIAVTTTLTVGASAAALTLSPSSVAAGGVFDVSGANLPANSTIALKLDALTLASSVAVGANGAFGPLGFTVPNGTGNGQHTISAVTSANQTLASATLTVTGATGGASLTVAPSTGVAGAQVTLTGNGFQGGETVLIAINNTTVAAGNANSGGGISIAFTLPQNLAAGNVILVATGQSSHATASATYTIPAATLTLSAGSAAVGASLTATGHNFAANEDVTLTINSVQVGTGHVDQTGAFSASFVVPSGAAGSTTVTATGLISHATATATFTRSSATLTANPTTAADGGSVALTGSGFTANEQVILSIPNLSLATVTANAQGGFSANVTIPANQATGNLTISAAGQSSHDTATVTVAVVVAAHLTVSTGSVTAGNALTITGSGFGASEAVALTIPGFTLATLTANAQGGFTANVAIPATAAGGAVSVTATGASTHRAATAALTIVAVPAHLTLSTGTVLLGAGLTVSGSGFAPNESVVIAVPGHTLLTLTATSAGSFSNIPLTIPTALNAGTFAVTATGTSSHRVASVSLTIQSRPAPVLSITPSTFSIGTPVRVTGSGFQPGEQVGLSINGGAAFATALAGSGGGFVLTATLPVTAAMSSAQIVATGVTSHASATASVSITALPPLTIGSTTWYYAAGRTDNGYSEQIAVLNPNNQATRGTITFFYNTNQTKSFNFTVQAHARGTYDVGQIIGAATRVGAMVRANLPIAAARTTERGSLDRMSTTGVSAPSNTWYMAEGYTGLTFQEDLSLLNPGNSTAHVHVVWPLFNGRAPVTYDVTMAPRTHMVIPVNSHVDRASHATVVSSDQPIVASRSEIFGAARQGATSKAGLTHAATTLYFAEGSTNNGFQEFLTILNPSSTQQAQVTANFYDRQGHLLGERTITVGPMHRGNIKVNDVVHNTAIATVLHSNIPIVAERAMYFGAPNAASAGGTVVFGQARPAQGWAFATGDTRPGHSEFELLFNPTATSSTIEATFYADNGQVVQKTFTLPGNARLNIDVTLSVPELARGYHGVVLRSLNGIAFVAEQAIYANNLTSGSATVGTPSA